MSRTPLDEEPTLGDEVRNRQRNTLPHEYISQDHLVDDVLWHGPRKGSKIQTAGAIVIGGVLFLGGIALANTGLQKGSYLGFLPMIVIGGFGARILYKSLKPSRRD